MQSTIDTAGVYALLAFVWIGVPAWIAYKAWSRRSIRRSKAEPVGRDLQRVQRERVTEIDAAPGSYRGPGRAGEPFFAPGGIAFLVSFVLLTLLAIWLRGHIEPIADWLFPNGRPTH